jgi:hypothetical protein
MSNIPTSRSSSPGAQHMRRYRNSESRGCGTSPKQDQRQDVEALQTAVIGLLYRAEEDLARRVTVGAWWASGNTSISGRGTAQYIRFDPWSWLSLQRAQA